MDIKISFSKVLQEARERKGLTQEQLAFASNLDRTYISLLERGLRNPTLETFFKISQSLDLDPSEFVKLIISKSENRP